MRQRRVSARREPGGLSRASTGLALGAEALLQAAAALPWPFYGDPPDGGGAAGLTVPR